MNIGLSLVVIAALFFYLLPSMIASIRHLEHGGAIIAINLLFGWTVLGWIAALIWAVVEKPRGKAEPEVAETPEQAIIHSDGRLTVKRAVQNTVLIIMAGLMRLMKYITA